MTSLKDLDARLKEVKLQLGWLFEQKGQTDWEVLQLGDEVDRLLNERNRLAQEAVG